MMTDNEVQDGKLYMYKGNEYFVSQCDNVEVKDPNDGNWYPAVIYYSAEAHENERLRKLVRRLDDFKAKFKPVQ